jgi:hypothetical protein
MSGTTQTFALAQKILKELYRGQPVKDLTYPELPFYAMVPKMEDMTGLVYPFPVKFANTVGASALFANAQANTYPAAYTRFAMPYAQKYITALIEGKAIRTTKNDKGAFVSLFTATVDSTIKGGARALAIDLVRSSAGVIGRVKSGYNTTTVTLYNASDCVNFEPGMVLAASAAADGSGLLTQSSQANCTIAAVNVDAGTLVMPVAWNTAFTSGANDNYIYRDGDATANINGFLDWCPASQPTVGGGDSFMGVDRSVHYRLYGTYLEASSAGTVEEALYRGLTLSSRKGGHVTHIFMNDVDFGNLEMSLASKVVLEGKASDAEIFFEGIRLRGPKGPVGVFADNTIPQGTAVGVPLEECELASVGPAIALLDEDGNEWLRQTSSDGYEIRFGFLGNFGCHDPNSLLQVALPTA